MNNKSMNELKTWATLQAFMAFERALSLGKELKHWTIQSEAHKGADELLQCLLDTLTASGIRAIFLRLNCLASEG